MKRQASGLGETMKELRCLVFTENEVVSAIIDRRRRMHEPLPEGTVRKVSFDTSAGTVTKLHLVNDYGQENIVSYPENEVAAAVIAFCMQRKVPLPVQADKTISVVNDALTLMIALNFNRPPRMVAQARTRGAGH